MSDIGSAFNSPEFSSAMGGATTGMMTGGPLGAAVGGGIGLLGGFLSNEMSGQRQQEAQGFSAQQQQIAAGTQLQEFQSSQAFNAQQAALARQSQQDFQAQQADIQRQYETQMSNTAYQRAVADMKAAGINPILAYQQGGASTPAVASPAGSSAQASAGAGSVPMGSSPGMAPVTNALQNAFSSGMDAAKLTETLANLKSNRLATDAGSALTDQKNTTEGTVQDVNRAVEKAKNAEEHQSRETTKNIIAARPGVEYDSVAKQLGAVQAQIQTGMLGSDWLRALYQGGVGAQWAGQMVNTAQGFRDLVSPGGWLFGRSGQPANANSVGRPMNPALGDFPNPLSGTR